MMFSRSRFAAAIAAIPFIGLAAAPEASAQWTVYMRPMQNPLPLGQCTAIEVVVKDANGVTPVRPNGSQVDWQDFELSFVSSAPDAFAWSNEAHRFLCARAPTAPTAQVVASYPGRHLRPGDVVPGFSVQQVIVVAMEGVPPGAGAGAAAGAAAPAGAGAGAAGAGQPQQAVYTTTAPSPVAAPAVAGVPAQPEVKKKGGFFKTLGTHLKEKANEVTNQTAGNLTSSATQVVDATAQTGSNLAAGATAEVTSAAQSKVGGVSTSLLPSSLRSGANADNLDLAVKSGQAVLRMIRFVGYTDVLDASGRDVVRRLAEVLKSNPGSYLIQAHVDPVPNPLDPQKLSEQQAAAVKAALIRSGVEEPRLKALGYGVSSPRPEVPSGGGPPTSARIEIWKMQ